MADAQCDRAAAVERYREVVAMNLGDGDEGAGAQAKKFLKEPWRPKHRVTPKVIRELENKEP
ncbi:MAG: hypothetical protein KC466_19320 [Myxococcales bacterium]|nr:hypothetical protein [Myxococcales bacterium]